MLTVSEQVSRLDGTRLAIASAEDPFGEATDFLANRGLGDRDFISVTGTEGNIGTAPVIFITDAVLASPAVADAPAANALTTDTINAADMNENRAAKTLRSGGKRSGAKGAKGAAVKSGEKRASAKRPAPKSGKQSRKGSKRGR